MAADISMPTLPTAATLPLVSVFPSALICTGDAGLPTLIPCQSALAPKLLVETPAVTVVSQTAMSLDPGGVPSNQAAPRLRKRRCCPPFECSLPERCWRHEHCRQASSAHGRTRRCHRRKTGFKSALLGISRRFEFFIGLMLLSVSALEAGFVRCLRGLAFRRVRLRFRPNGNESLD